MSFGVKCPKIDCGDSEYTKSTNLSTLGGGTAWYVNDSSLKRF